MNFASYLQLGPKNKWNCNVLTEHAHWKLLQQSGAEVWKGSDVGHAPLAGRQHTGQTSGGHRFTLGGLSSWRFLALCGCFCFVCFVYWFTGETMFACTLVQT